MSCLLPVALHSGSISFLFRLPSKRANTRKISSQKSSIIIENRTNFSQIFRESVANVALDMSGTSPNPEEPTVSEENILERDLDLSGDDEEASPPDEPPQSLPPQVPQDAGEPKGIRIK
jgi:hypothetical protein